MLELPGKHSLKREDNTKAVLKGILKFGRGCIDLAQDRDKLLVLLKMAMNHRVPKMRSTPCVPEDLLDYQGIGSMALVV